MSGILAKFYLANNLGELEKDIKIFHIFENQRGKTILFITSTDKIYGFGQNSNGECGQGHNSPINEPQIISELCEKNINQFFIGSDFVLGKSCDFQLYGWGKNNFGQLGLDYFSAENEFLKPKKIGLEDNFLEISCGSTHTLAITNNGIFAWGNNSNGQVGCGSQFNIVSAPFKLEINKTEKFKIVRASSHQSFAITNNQTIFSWGLNNWCSLGHDIDLNECVYEPKMIIHSNVVDVCPINKSTFFLTTDQKLYYCGFFPHYFQKTLKEITIGTNVESFQLVNGHDTEPIATLKSRDGFVHEVTYRKFVKTSFESYFDYYADNHQITPDTIELEYQDVIEESLGETSQVFLKKYIFNSFKIFENIAEEIKLKIEIFHIININGKQSLIFVTYDGDVFSIGSNIFGCTGLGHDRTVNELERVNELCNKNMIKFFTGSDFLLGISNDNKLYGWGRNDNGQLALGFKSDINIYLKPLHILDNITQVCSGVSSSFALSSNGELFGWGLNYDGTYLLNPVKLENFENVNIKSIHSCGNIFSVLSFDDIMYIWNSINHQTIQQILGVNTISTVLSGIYFLDDNGRINFLENSNTPGKFNKIVKISTTLIEGQEIIFKLLSAPGKAVSDVHIYNLDKIRINKTNYKSIFESLLNEKQSLETFNFIQKYCYIQKSRQDNQNETNQYHQSSNEPIIRKAHQTIVSHSSISQTKAQHYATHTPPPLNNWILIGEGGYGFVYKVENSISLEFQALKVIEIKDDPTGTLTTGILNEVEVMSKLSSKYVVKYHSHWQELNKIFILMELCTFNLAQLLSYKSDIFKRQIHEMMSATEYWFSCEIFKEILQGVKYLHDGGIIHRDLKPMNILVVENPKNGIFIKICDLGLAKYGGEKTNTHTQGQGTFKYMAPEVKGKNINGKSRYSIKADIYGLGIICTEIFDLDFNSAKSKYWIDIIKEQGDELVKQIIRMLTSHTFHDRPTCGELILSSVNWSIKKEKLLISELPNLTQYPSTTFFKNYYQEKFQIE